MPEKTQSRTMRRFWWLLAITGVFAAVLAVGVFVQLSSPPRPGITRANVARIQPGMSQQQVEEILASPPHAKLLGSQTAWANTPPRCASILLWTTDEMDVLVYVNQRGRVIGCDKTLSPSYTWWERVREWFGIGVTKQKEPAIW